MLLRLELVLDVRPFPSSGSHFPLTHFLTLPFQEKVYGNQIRPELT